MELRTLRAFVEVVRQGTFSSAAKVVFASQSAVSKAVAQLEQELGVLLLKRTGYSAAMTDAGKIVFRRATAILSQVDDLTTELGELNGLHRGTLRLGLPLVGAHLVFAGWLAEYRNRFPQIHVVLVERGTKRLEEMVLEDELDLAASLLPADERFDRLEVRREPLDVLIAADHPLANCPTLGFADLAQESFVLYGAGFGLNTMIVQACKASGFVPQIACHSSQVDLIIGLVAARLGIALIPRAMARLAIEPTVRLVPLDDPNFSWNLSLVWRRDSPLSHAARAWLSLAGPYVQPSDSA
jgi:DNA-binding transcriptional LysR family regulator